MSPSLRYPRAEWEAVLQSYGCKPLAGKGPLNTAEFWQMPFQHFPFTVPRDDDGFISQADLDWLICLICQSAPEGWKFPE